MSSKIRCMVTCCAMSRRLHPHASWRQCRPAINSRAQPTLTCGAIGLASLSLASYGSPSDA
eukprot:2176661-Pyramimonas_sp.AAC.1